MSKREAARGAVATAGMRHNLEPAPTSFVGREAELAQVARLLREARLVTVSGPPGAGKTRLASELAARLLADYAGGAWFVGLAPVADPRLVLPTIANVLGVRLTDDRSVVEAIRGVIEDQPTLIVVDNFEHLTESATDVAALLGRVPTVRILATSRVPLHISGEHEFVLRPLHVPDVASAPDVVARTEAVELFARRALAAEPTFRVDENNARDVGELCRRLDGLPLAIELAAARVKLLSLPAIVSRLDHGLSLLSGGPRDVPPRHRSIRAAVEWSYELLDPEAQHLFRRLSVFRGGWTIDGAAALSDGSEQRNTFETLAALLDASVLVPSSANGSDPRFTMLETLREYAAERLAEGDETGEVRDRHAQYFVELAERLEPDFIGPQQADALDRVAIDHDNFRAALRYLVSANPELALRLAASLWRFWQMRGHLIEGSRWLAAALDAAGQRAAPEIVAKAHTAAGGLAYWRGNTLETRAHYEEALRLRRTLNDPVRIADAVYDLGFSYGPFFVPSPEDAHLTTKALRLGSEAEELYRAAGHEIGVARTGWMIGSLMLYRDMAVAESLLAASVERFRVLGEPFGLGWAVRMHGLALLGLGNSGAAADEFREAIRVFETAGDTSATGLLLDDFGDVARAEGDAIRGARLKGAAAAIRHLSEAEVANVDQPWQVTAASVQLADPDAVAAAWTEGQQMSPSQAVAYALDPAATATAVEGLRISAFGSFTVLRAGEPISQWGGPKAGSRQAKAMFAFLLDRGERGVTKDEFVEVIWPDANVVQGDLNFHRTLGGLRATLQPTKAAGSSRAVAFRNGRYRLNASLVGWLDVAEFEQRLSNAGQATDELAAIRGLEAARTLYHGDYLDDCPLYGDSEYVEERRRFLRGRLADALVDLGRRYEARSDASLAAARYREALTVTGGDCPSAVSGLERVGVSA